MIVDEPKLVQRIAYGDIPKGWKYDTEYYGWSSPKRTKVVGKLAVYSFIQDHTCSVCGAGPDIDIRWLRLACFYELSEISNKFRTQKVKIEESDRNLTLFLLPVCKKCRGNFMVDMLQPWLEGKKEFKLEEWSE